MLNKRELKLEPWGRPRGMFVVSDVKPKVILVVKRLFQFSGISHHI